MFRFEKLDVWRRAIEFADEVYEATSTFPSEEKFGLKSQMRRAAVSISSNIAEGSGRVSDADFRRFIEFAYGSLMESVSHSEIAQRLGFLSKEQHEKVRTAAEELARMLSGLRSTLSRQP